MKVLFLAPNPADLPRFDPGRFSNLQPHADLTETGIKGAFNAGRYDLVHFVGHARSRGANYATLAVLSSDGRARWVPSGAIAAISELSGAKLWVLQACDDASLCFDSIAQAIASRGVMAIVAPALNGRSFVDTLYGAVERGAPASLVAQQLTALDGRIRVFAAHPSEAILPGPPSLLPVTATVEQPVQAAWHERLAVKRQTGSFDVFLCHNSGDKPAVKRLGQRLKEEGILPWLDEWELQPGQPWQQLLENQLGGIRTAAVFAGAAGLGPWQRQEIDAFLREFVRRKCPVIPVLLPDAPIQPELPVFLGAMTWVDFRTNDPDPWARLLWGITGKRPFD